MKVYETPRNVMMKSGVRFDEMETNRENAWCCGAGGGARAGYSDWSLLTANTRLEQAGGNTRIVTACPFCVKNLRDGSEETHEVVDLVELIDRIT
jgi:Fe-S oxidoreductase